MRAAGRMGGNRVTIHNLKVLRVDPDNHLLIVEGGIPGAPTGDVIVRKAVTAKKLKVAQVEKPKKGKKYWLLGGEEVVLRPATPPPRRFCNYTKPKHSTTQAAKSD